MFTRILATLTLTALFISGIGTLNISQSSAAQESAAHKTKRLKKQIAGAVDQVLDNRASQDADVVKQTQKRPATLLDLDVQETANEQKITLNFSKELLNENDEADTILGQVLTSIGNLPEFSSTEDSTLGVNVLEFTILIDGVPLHELFAERDRQIREGVIPGSGETDSQALQEMTPYASLPGKRVAISPGHGWYHHETLGWQLQRPYKFGIVEDFVNAEMVMYLNGELASTGADVRPTRNLNKNAGTGVSGKAKWEECAKYHIQALGAPSSVWNTGSTDYNKDITSRPLYANWVNANVLVSLHNNAGGGTGTETWYDTSNGQQTESRKLATAIHNKVVSTIRREYNPNWTDRLVKGSNSAYGENTYATRPSVVLEVAFMDRQSPDNNALHDERFKRLVARAVREGTEEYFGAGQTAGDFSITTTPITLSVARGSNATCRVDVQSINGFSGQVSLSGLNFPPGYAGAFWTPTSSVTVPQGGVATATLVVQTNSNTSLGTFNITIKAVSGSLVKQKFLQWTITSADARDEQAKQDMRNRAARDWRFFASIPETFGKDLNWTSDFELRWMAFYFSGNRIVSMYHARAKASGTRFTSFFDPDTGRWTDWVLAQ